tara:strand:- start:295 stop:531 length:237 start_codon:yes stop_codon:yes gene_type:complete
MGLNFNYQYNDTIHVNAIEEYLKENIGKKLSLRTIYKNLKIKRRKIIWLLNKSKHIKKVQPYEVGSGKYTIHVYTYVE